MSIQNCSINKPFYFIKTKHCKTHDHKPVVGSILHKCNLCFQFSINYLQKDLILVPNKNYGEFLKNVRIKYLNFLYKFCFKYR